MVKAPVLGFGEDAEGASIRPQAGGYAEVDGVTRRVAGSNPPYRFQDDRVATSADVIDNEGVVLAASRRTRRRDAVVPLPGVGVTGGLRGSHSEGYSASCGEGKSSTTTDGIIVCIGDLGPGGVLHDDGDGIRHEGVIGANVIVRGVVRIGIDGFGDDGEDTFSVRVENVGRGISVGLRSPIDFPV
jgi:hypothetical protein